VPGNVGDGVGVQALAVSVAEIAIKMTVWFRQNLSVVGSYLCGGNVLIIRNPNIQPIIATSNMKNMIISRFMAKFWEEKAKRMA
jgi:hypothetical protein